MCFHALIAVWSYRGEDLPVVERAVLSRMAAYASFKGRDIFPSLPTLAAEVGAHVSTVQRAIKILIEKGFLTKDKHYSESDTKSNKYILNVDRLKSNHLSENDFIACNPLLTESSTENVDNFKNFSGGVSGEHRGGERRAYQYTI